MRPALFALIFLAVAGCQNPATNYNAPGNPNAVSGADNNLLVQVDQVRGVYTAALNVIAPLLEANNSALAKQIPQADKDAVRSALTEVHNGLDQAESYARSNKPVDFQFVMQQVNSALGTITAFRLKYAPATQPTGGS